MRGQQTDCVMTSQGSAQVMSGADSGKVTGDNERNNPKAMTTVEITPVKAPNDIKSAIRRQKRTETLDYIWHALPVTRSAKPLYRAVLRGALQPGNVQCAFTHVNGHVVKASDVTMTDDVVSLSDDVTYSHQFNTPPVRLQVTGVSINDIKLQEPSGSSTMSPRAKFGQPLPVSRYMKPAYLEQRSPNPVASKYRRGGDHNNNNNHNTNNNSNCIHEDQIVERAASHNRSTSNIPPLIQNGNGASYTTKVPNAFASNSNGNNNNTKSQRLTPTLDDKSWSLTSPPLVNASLDSAKGLTKSRALAKRNLKKESSVNSIKDSKNNDDKTTTATLRTPSAIEDTSLTSGPQLTSFTTGFVHREDSTRQMFTKNSIDYATATTKKSPLATDSTVPQLPDASAYVKDLSCIQLADSIIGAVNGDLTQVYSLCKTKLRYSDFIEQAQPHRLGDAHWHATSAITGNVEPNVGHESGDSRDVTTESLLQTSSSTTTSKTQVAGTRNTITSNIASAAAGSPNASTAVTKRLMPRLPGVPVSPTMPHLHLTTVSNNNNNKSYKRVRDSSDIEANRAFQTTHHTTSLTLGKAGRPILKTSRSDMESNTVSNSKQRSDSSPRTCHGGLDSDGGLSVNSNSVAQITNSINNSRLVRFNTCHEVREFTPSEPVRLQ